MFVFENLDDKTRSLMLQELEYDLGRGTIFFDIRLKEGAKVRYIELLREALEYGTPEIFSEAILGQQLLKETETRDLGEKQIRAKISNIAHYNIGEVSSTATTCERSACSPSRIAWMRLRFIALSKSPNLVRLAPSA